MAGETILLVEDEEALRLFIGDSLRQAGYGVDFASDGNEGLTKATSQPVDLIVLDIMLPGRDGFEVCQSIRSRGHKMPILMLTARGRSEDTVQGLRIGADDYVAKPFHMGELIARIDALLRRVPARHQLTHFAFGSITVDFPATEVSRRGRRLALSAREFQLLQFLVENRGKTLSRELILREVWGYSPGTFTRTVDMRIANLRQHLEDDPKQPQFILTVQGLGYKFRGDDAETEP